MRDNGRIDNLHVMFITGSGCSSADFPLSDRFKQEDIGIPFLHMTVYVREENDGKL